MSLSSLLALYPDSLHDAIATQNELRKRVRIENDHLPIKTIAGVDVSYDINHNIVFAFIVVLHKESLETIEAVRASAPVSFPYVPGFLSFREIPAILSALDQLSTSPDILMVDGQGIAHPRRLGIAAHLGVLTDTPAIGVAKSRLVGWHKEVGVLKGQQTPLLHGNEQIGTVLRSKNHVKPLYVSPGHRVDHATAISLTIDCLTRYRLPEPTRLADKLSKTCKNPESVLLPA